MPKKFQFPSKSNAKDIHQVTLYEDGRLSCSCRGFRTPNKCWHVKEVAEKENLNVVIGGEVFGKTSELHIVKPPEPQPLFGPTREMPVDVMLARAMPDHLDLSDFQDYVYEVKYDGHRIEAEVGDKVTAWSRAGNVRSLPKHIVEELKRMAPGLYDTELFVPGGTSTDVTALHLQSKLRLAVFDMLRVGPQSAIDQACSDRRKLLTEASTYIMRTAGAPVFVAPQYDKPSVEKLEKLCKEGNEGIILKKPNGKYQPGVRSLDWVKMKQGETATFTIVGFEAGSLGPHSKLVLQDEFGVQISVKALNDQWRAVFADQWMKFIGTQMTVNYQVKTVSGKYRHPMAGKMVSLDHLIGESHRSGGK